MSRLTYNKVLILVVIAIQVRITSIPVLKTACQFHPGTTSNQSNFLDSCLTSIQILFCLKMDSKFLATPSSRWHLNSSQVTNIISQLHSGPISNPYKPQDVCLKSIQVLTHLHPGPNIFVSPPSTYNFSFIQVTMFASQTMSCLNSNQVPIFGPHLHLGRVSPKCMSRE